MAKSYEAFAAEVSRRLEYTYPEDLPIWKNNGNDVIHVGSPVIENINKGDVIFINQRMFGRLFLLDMLRAPMMDYIPVAFLSSSKAEKENMEDGLISVLMDIGGSEKGMHDFIAAQSVLSKRLRAKRFCEVEDELIVLSQKGYRIAVISTLERLPYLDAESREKGYESHSEALIEIAKRTGIAIVVFTLAPPKARENAICLSITPIRRMFLPPSGIIVEKDRKDKFELKFKVTDRSGFEVTPN